MRVGIISLNNFGNSQPLKPVVTDSKEEKKTNILDSTKPDKVSEDKQKDLKKETEKGKVNYLA